MKKVMIIEIIDNFVENIIYIDTNEKINKKFEDLKNDFKEEIIREFNNAFEIEDKYGCIKSYQILEFS